MLPPDILALLGATERKGRDLSGPEEWGGGLMAAPDFPKTEEEAIQRAAFLGCPVSFVSKTWNKALGRGGRDARNVIIRSFSGFLKAEWRFERERLAQMGHYPGTDPTARPKTIAQKNLEACLRQTVNI